MKRMKRAQKEELVRDFSQKLSSSSGFILTDFTGLDVITITELRRKLHQVGVEYLVVKNRLAQKALGETSLSDALKTMLTDSSTAFAFLSENPFVCPKVLVDFSKSREALKIKGGVLQGNVLSKGEVEALAKISSAKEVYGRLVSALKSPLYRLATDCNHLLTKLVTVLNQVAKKRESTEGTKA
jgi:large subunit ribosomal protein L10